MTNKLSDFGQHLRSRAEDQLRCDHGNSTVSVQAAIPADNHSVDLQQLLHDLQVHQIELQMQNEELRRSEAELEVARARYFELYDLAPIGYLTLNEQGQILEANLFIASMLGVVRKQLFNQPLSQYIYRNDQDLYYLYRNQIAAGNTIQTCELRLVRADGAAVWMHLQSAPAKNGEFWIALLDISERKKSEADNLVLERQFQQAQKLESLGVLAGGIAHDFNNILTIILGHCSLATMYPKEAGDHIAPIATAAERAASLCRQMLAYAGKSTLVMTQVSIAAIVDEMVRMLKATISQNVLISLYLSDEIPLIKGDASQIRQVLMNLIINATEAIGESQGEIRITLSTTVIKPGIMIKDHLGLVVASGRYVCLEVSDDGCGMDDETLQRIFEPFFSTKFAGRGLGMSAVLGIILAHGGSLQVVSHVGQGTTFRLLLPIELRGSAGVEDSEQLLSGEPWQGSGMVLLVEDEEPIQCTVRAMLQDLGFNVLTASNGSQALELYREHVGEITLVVTDIGMPVMNGYELIHELKCTYPALPIIISSGYGDGIVTSRIPQEDIAGLVSKPFRFEQLREVVRMVVEGGQ